MIDKFKGRLIPYKIHLPVLLLILLLTTTACSRQQEPIHETQLLSLGTLVNISLWDVEEKRAAQAIAAIENKFNDIHHQWHAWQPGYLSNINKQLAAGATIELDDDSLQLIIRAQELAHKSDQLFNPAIGKLISLWGFHSDERPDSPPPESSAIHTLLDQQPSMANLVITNNTLRSTNPAVQLDFGGFAKGYAVDIAIDELKRLGIKHAIVNAGGDLRAIGRRGERAWRIGIRHPQQAGIIASLETAGDESIFTSGNYERYFDYQGVRYHHIIDPRSGYPAKNTVSVTVIHNNAATADAAATALLVAGPSQWQTIARQMGLDQVMLIDSDMVIHMTQTMARRVFFENNPSPETRIITL